MQEKTEFREFMEMDQAEYETTAWAVVQLICGRFSDHGEASGILELARSRMVLRFARENSETFRTKPRK